MKPIPVNWCRSCGGGKNFGDQLTPVLLEAAGVEFEWAAPARARMFGVGSIVSKIPRRGGYTGRVWGTGTIREGVGRDLRRARVLGVRGELTRRECRLAKGTVLGDPGILFTPGSGPVGGGGDFVVPHYVDKAIRQRHPAATVLPITTPPYRFMEEIRRADRVFSSSLHAVIAADVLGIPHILEPHDDVIGGLWKFRDYASAFGEDFVAGVERLTDRESLLARQLALVAAFEEEFGDRWGRQMMSPGREVSW